MFMIGFGVEVVKLVVSTVVVTTAAYVGWRVVGPAVEEGASIATHAAVDTTAWLGHKAVDATAELLRHVAGRNQPVRLPAETRQAA